MPQLEKPTKRVCVRLFADNVEFLEQFCQETGQKFNLVVRESIRTVCVQLGALERKHLDKVSPLQKEVSQKVETAVAAVEVENV